MSLRNKYAEIQRSFKGINMELAKKVLDILEDPGSLIIKSDDLKSGTYTFSLEKILTLSKNMKRGMDEFLENIKRIGMSDGIENGAQFYVTDFGGSKSQYIELLKSKIYEFREKDNRPFTEIITVSFNGTLDLTATYLGESIEHNTARLLASQLDWLKRSKPDKIDSHTFENFLDLLVEFRKIKDAPDHLENIYAHLSELERVSGGEKGIKLKISLIRKDLMKLPLVDEARLLNTVLNIMKYASKYSILFILFFDECDEWLSQDDADSSLWNNNFKKRQYFFRKLYDNITDLRLYQVYCLTPRVHEVLRGPLKDFMSGAQRIASDLTKIKSTGSLISVNEFGAYIGEEAKEVVLKWLVLIERIINKPDDVIFTSFLPRLVEKVDNKLSRRIANSEIVSSIKSFMELTDEIKSGQDQYNYAEKTHKYNLIGDCIDHIFPIYLNNLNFHFLKKHIDVGDEKKIDGRFLKVRTGEKEIYAEIKTMGDIKNFVKSKLDQALNCIKNLDSIAIIFLFCPGLTDFHVKDKLYEWKNHGHIDRDIDLDKIIPFVISDQTILNCLVGLRQVDSTSLDEKLVHFNKLLRLLNKDFHGKLYNIFPSPKKEPDAPKVPEGASGRVPPAQSYNSLLSQMQNFTDTKICTAVEIITIMGSTDKVYMRRKIDKVKGELGNLLKDSFNEGFDLLNKYKIMKDTGDNITFIWSNFENKRQDEEDFMIEVFQTFLTKIETQ